MSPPEPQTFNVEVWKEDYCARAAMIDDIRSKIKGKGKIYVENLLGKPDSIIDNQNWAYKVIINPRCRFIWTCGMRVYFDNKEDKVIGVGVSD